MRFGRFMNGLRFEVLGNLAVVSIISLLLTGFGVWFINGNQLLKQKLHQDKILIGSVAEEVLSLLPPVSDEKNPAAAAGTNHNIQEVLTRYQKKDPRIHLVFVDQHYHVLASTWKNPLTDVAKNEILAVAFAKKSSYTHLEGKAPFWGYYQSATLVIPLVKEGKLLGGIMADLSLEDILGNTRQTVKFLLLYMGMGTLVLLVFGTILISRTIVHPLDKTIRVMQRVADGDFQQKVPVSSENEMGQLAIAFNAMAEKLKENQKILNGHVKTLRKMNHELKQSQQEVIQSEKLASVGLLAAGIAHEIGNPLGAVIGYISMLEQCDENSYEHKDYLNRMEKEALRIDRIVKDLLHYSRPSALDIKPSDINRIILNVVNLVKRQKDFKFIRFEVCLQDSSPQIFIDATQFQQVLINLFVNAKDAMASEGTLKIATYSNRFMVDPPNVSIVGPACREDDPPGVDFRILRKDSPARQWPFLDGQDLVDIIVTDTGSGISEEDLPRVFDPFFTNKETGQGTGLGLSVSQRIIQSFHGQIQIESQAGKGTSVRIRLPVALKLNTPAHQNNEEAKLNGTASSHCG